MRASDKQISETFESQGRFHRGKFQWQKWEQGYQNKQNINKPKKMLSVTRGGIKAQKNVEAESSEVKVARTRWFRPLKENRKLVG